MKRVKTKNQVLCSACKTSPRQSGVIHSLPRQAQTAGANKLASWAVGEARSAFGKSPVWVEDAITSAAALQGLIAFLKRLC